MPREFPEICPEGTTDNSPTLQCWVKLPNGFKSRRDGRIIAEHGALNQPDSLIPYCARLKALLNFYMSYVSSHYHCVFSTKERRPQIQPALRDRLWPFLGGIARQNRMTALEIGGMPDHVHLLLALPSTMPLSKALQLIKGDSSKWVHDTFPQNSSFGWQVKYGAFSVSVSLLDKAIQYIRNQERHHRKMTFKEEFLAMLKKHRVTYDERYLWE